MPPFLSKPKVAKRYGVVTRTIDRRVELGSLRKPDLRVSGYPYWDQALLDEDDGRPAGGADAVTDAVTDLPVPDTPERPDPEVLARRSEQRKAALKTARARAALVRTRASPAASDLAD